MNIIVGEITYQYDGYYVVLIVYNPEQIPVNIVLSQNEDFIVTNVDILKLPTKVMVKMNACDKLYYSINESLTEIPIDLSTKKIYNIFTYSCDNPSLDCSKSLWTTLAKDVRECVGRSLAIGLGDNIYGDRAWEKSLLAPERTTDNYMKCYGKTLFGTDRKNVLLGPNSNLFILDDHEVTNNFTVSQGLIFNEDMTNQAMNVYKRFLENCHFSLENTIDRGWIKHYDDLLIVSFERTTRGRPGIDEIISSLNSAITPEVKNIIMITAWACIPSPRDNMKAKLYRNMCSMHKFMSDDDLYVLYNHLLLLSEKYSIILIGGDLHFGSKFTVTRGTTSFDIMITSPITNQPSSERKLAAKALKGQTIQINNISVHNISAKAKRCYGKILVSHPLVSSIVYHTE